MGKFQPFDDLDAETDDALRKSIARFGVVCPVIVDGNGRIIDGHQRVRIAGELGLTYPTIKRAVRNEDDAISLAYSLNADRRQLTVEQRRAIVADLRAQGYSLRAIAGVTKTSVGTAHHDVQATGVQVDHVNGDDGKTYGATRAGVQSEHLPPNVDENGEIVSPTGDTEFAGGGDEDTSGASGRTPDAPAEPASSSPVPPKNPTLTLLADFSRIRAEAAKWPAFDKHEEVIDAMTTEQRADYRAFVKSMFDHANATLDRLDAPARLQAVK